MESTDWAAWHDDYDRVGSSLARRLVLVQGHLRSALDAAPEGEIRIVSLCAGQGRDVIEVVAAHPRSSDVVARLVELDPRNVAYARTSAKRSGLDNIDVVEADASVTDAYAGAVPANIVMACGIFGNMSDADVHATIDRLAELCAADATVIWTRHRRLPDLTPSMLAWFGEAGFEALAVEAPPETNWVGVGAHRFVAQPQQLRRNERIFTFERYAINPQ